MPVAPDIRFDFTGILFMVFSLALLIQVWYVIRFPLRLAIYRKKEGTAYTPPVSIIVCARNEEDNLFKNLPAILEQDYPDFEVIVVNDMSIDDSKHIIQAYQKQYKHLRIIELEKNRHRKFGKKVPLTVGIKGSSKEVLMMIDADCYPSGKYWLRRMVSNYMAGKEIVIGYGPYEKQKGFLNKLIRFDTIQIALTYLSFALVGRPYMAVGRNMSYTRKLFFDVDGFKSHYHIQSGDDDLFMKDAATKRNVAIEIDPRSFVFSHPKENWSDWVHQKQRHFTTAPRYRLINKLLLGIFPASMILMLLSFFILLPNCEWWWLPLSMIVFRYIMYWLILRVVFRKLEGADLVKWYPVMEMIHLIVIPFIFYSTDRREPEKW